MAIIVSPCQYNASGGVQFLHLGGALRRAELRTTARRRISLWSCSGGQSALWKGVRMKKVGDDDSWEIDREILGEATDLFPEGEIHQENGCTMCNQLPPHRLGPAWRRREKKTCCRSGQLAAIFIDDAHFCALWSSFRPYADAFEAGIAPRCVKDAIFTNSTSSASGPCVASSSPIATVRGGVFVRRRDRPAT